ncbi:hypothetical protein BD324DRAFT_633753 [Kockovaella imperatae]|uniref:Cytochrome c oxidase assembly factor 3 n=1 Tax=Kockovaella imperatae TaxID=4999 RepID=A0A1Y1UBZ2_9TREE|nr:hypothetical protein BD324DRAFT_633753 [Kockovaella imperatae]ORX35054.1 hypothetical protein BD324DRAFT_633753 [Kockovaella imperatae]
MSDRGWNQRSIDETYFPRPGQMSESLKRARRPFIWPNRIYGLGLVCFSLGIYAYSIAAVQQDDFSDVEDLLPPVEERSSLKSIEDEEREKGGPSHLRRIPGSLSTGSAMSPPPPGQKDWGGSSDHMGPGHSGRWYSSFLPRRLSDIEWVRRAGLVERESGNVLVWAAPPIDQNMRIGDGKPSKGPRLV